MKMVAECNKNPKRGVNNKSGNSKLYISQNQSTSNKDASPGNPRRIDAKDSTRSNSQETLVSAYILVEWASVEDDIKLTAELCIARFRCLNNRLTCEIPKGHLAVNQSYHGEHRNFLKDNQSQVQFHTLSYFRYTREFFSDRCLYISADF